MSMFGNTTHNPFTRNMTSNAPMSFFGNTSNSSLNTTGNASIPVYNPFSVNSTGNGSTSSFGNTNNSNPNPFAGNTFGNTTSPSLPFQMISFDGTSTRRFGESSSSVFGTAGFTSHGSTNSNPFGSFSPSTGSPFGQPSNGLFGPRGPASTIFAGTSTSVSSSSSPSLSFGVTQTPAGQNKGSKIRPYEATKDDGSSKLVSISAMSNYGSKCHEELRLEDYEMKSTGTIPPQGPVFTPAVSLNLTPSSTIPSFNNNSLFSSPAPPSNITPSSTTTPAFNQSPFQNPNTTSTNLQNPFFTSPVPSLNLTPSSTIPSFNNNSLFRSPAPPSNITPSSTTPPAFNQSPFQNLNTTSTSLQNPFFTSPVPSLNLTPSSTIPSFNNNSLFRSPAPPSNITPSSTATPAFNQSPFQNPNTTSTSLQNPFFTSPVPSLNLTPSSTILSFNSLFRSPAPPSNITPSSTTTLAFNQSPFQNLNTTSTSLQNPFQNSFNQLSTVPSLNLTPPSTTTPAWEAITKTITTSPVLENQPPFKPSTDCIVAVKDPFGSQSATPHPAIVQPICSPLFRNGISSIPVIDKPATTRVSSLVSSRHISSRPLKVHARKYHPKSDDPKVPFFVNTDGTQNTQKASSFIIPRNNPRSMFMTDASASLHEDGSFDDTSEGKDKKDQASSSSPSYMDCKKPVTKNCIQVNISVPKLHRSDYYTQPSIDMLRSAETSEPGFCSNVKDFVIGRHGYGWIKFEGETDVRGLDLDDIVSFNKLEVIVYEDDNEKPEVGEGLNKHAEITLLNVKCTDKTGKQYCSGKIIDKFIEKLKKVGENQGAEFISYDAVNGIWKFQVKHFSPYGIIQ